MAIPFATKLVFMQNLLVEPLEEYQGRVVQETLLHDFWPKVVLMGEWQFYRFTSKKRACIFETYFSF